MKIKLTRRAKKSPLPSKAQARNLARIFADGRPVPLADDGYVPPTISALAKRKWIVSTDLTGTYPNGSTYHFYELSEEGISALSRYFAEITKAGA